jgi:6-phosphogluconate dehydrogenase
VILDGTADFALIGLDNQALEFAEALETSGSRLVLFDEKSQTTLDFCNGPGLNRNFLGVDSIEELINTLVTPRKIFIGGAPEDVLGNIRLVLPHLNSGDCVIDLSGVDGTHSASRASELKSVGIAQLDLWVESAGEQGVVLFASGAAASWEKVKSALKQAVIQNEADRRPQCWPQNESVYVGPAGGAHYLKSCWMNFLRDRVNSSLKESLEKLKSRLEEGVAQGVWHGTSDEFFQIVKPVILNREKDSEAGSLLNFLK